jgi:hypothetical protein
MKIASAALCFALCTASCKGPVLPAAENIVSVVLADLQANKTDAQIASDVCSALGGTSATDAICASVETVVQDVATYLIDAGLVSGASLEHAKAIRAKVTK